MTDELDSLKEKMDQLKKEYKQNLPSKVDHIITKWISLRNGNWQNGQFNDLLSSIHKLAGSGGVFGYLKVSEVALKIEISLRNSTGSKKQMNYDIIKKIDHYLDELKNEINARNE